LNRNLVIESFFRYADVAKAYTDLEAENQKVKSVMQQTQVKVSHFRTSFSQIASGQGFEEDFRAAGTMSIGAKGQKTLGGRVEE